MNLAREANSAITSINLTNEFNDDFLKKLGESICTNYDEDKGSRTDWEDRANFWLKLATQIIEKKSYPWPDAANVKYPLLTIAAMQFAARAYPALVPGASLVGAHVVGSDMDGSKAARAKRVAAHMSWQLMYEMEDWEEDMDKLCIILPIMGVCFKKSYYCNEKKTNISSLVLPQDLVVHYYAKSVEEASRKFHRIWFSPNRIYEKIGLGEFREFIYGQSQGTADKKEQEKRWGLQEPKLDEDTPHEFIEAHCYYDLDEDGYKEPWVITVHKETKTVVRIVARFTSEGITLDAKGKIAKIDAIEYFTKFPFIPNPDGSLYDLGFGILLGGINESVNTITNQLLDSGTVNNLQGGFLGRGIRVRGGNTRFVPGEWKPVDFSGDDIKKHIFPIPTKEPSAVLFELFQALVQSGKELSSIAEIMVGKMPGQNTPATTTLTAVKEGQAIFTAIYKRLWRALSKEYKKLFELNKLHLDTEDGPIYFSINQPEGPQSQQIMAEDYSDKITVKPSADPSMASEEQKLIKLQAVGSLLQLGTIQPMEYTKRTLEALSIENMNALLNTQPPPPDPKTVETQVKAQLEQGKQELEKRKQEFAEFMGVKELEMKKHEQDLKDKEQQIKEKEIALEALLEHKRISSAEKIAKEKPNGSSGTNK